MKLDIINDKDIFLKSYYRKIPCKCSWNTSSTPQGWQSVLENIEQNVRNEQKMIITKSAGYIIPKPTHHWSKNLINEYKEFKNKDEYIQAHLYVSLFGFSELFGKHNDPDQNIFVVAGEGSAEWAIDGFDNFLLEPNETLYLPGHIYHHARSLGPRYSISVVIESEESYNRDNTSGKFHKK